MAKSTLPTNFKDDILNSSMGGKRRYKLINNSDGTVSLEDASAYDQVGSEYGASQVNAANAAVNASADAGKIIDDIDDINAVTAKGYIAGALALKNVNNSLGGMKFGKDGDGNYGYYGADGSLIPFNGYKTITRSGTYSVKSGYPTSCTIGFSDVFEKEIIGIQSFKVTNGLGVVGAFGKYANEGIQINNSNLSITFTTYGGQGGINTDITNGQITVTAIGR